ncbi:MAG: HAD-IC family P-type ATPase [Chthoniobacterales bacterium]|nr:HAD-IC family P-type ATPase [Chthoniobacterales bacterium]
MPDVPLKTIAGEQLLHSCRHCRTRFRPSADEQEFCCSGCRFVHHLLHKRGLGDFYSYGETMSPAGNFVFHDRDYRWLESQQRASEAGAGDVAETIVDVQGISCAACLWLIEAVFMECPGAVSCVVNSSSGTARLRWTPGALALDDYARDVQRFGYLLGPPQGKAPSSMGSLTRKLGLCGFLAMNAMLFASPRYFGIEPGDALTALFDVVSFGLATASIAIGGTFFFRRALGALRMGALHIDLPISLGLLIAYAGSVGAWLRDQHSFNYFDFVSVFTFLMLLGRWLQERAVENNRRRLLGLKLSPGRVRVMGDPAAGEKGAEEIVSGLKFAVARGQVVPVRSRLLERSATFALNWITGEPAPRTFPAGSIVPAGARSVDADDTVFEALEDWADSQLSALLRIDAERQWRNRGLEKLIKVYLSIVMVVAALGFVAWGWSGGDWPAAFQVMISVLVVSCPCAIGVALPLLDDIAAARLQQYGVYLREGSLWARLKQVTTLLFDKTGTVTLETLRPADPAVFDTLSAETKSYLMRLVERSLHPVAACLREVLLSSGVEPATGGGMVHEIPGMGLEWESPVGLWRLGRAAWALHGGESGGTILALDGTALARFDFREELRPDAADQVAHFASRGMPVYLLSGDEPARVKSMAHVLGLPESHAMGGLTPAEKAGLVRARWSGNALMLGDGANDSLAFDAALCRGTPAVDAGLLEHKADFYLLGRGLHGLGALFAAGRSHHRTARAVFGFALLYNACAVSAALAGWMSPLVAAVIMPLSSLVCIGIVLTGFRISTPLRTKTQNS